MASEAAVVTRTSGGVEIIVPVVGALTAQAESRWLDLGNRKMKHLDAILFEIETTDILAAVQVEVATAEYSNEVPMWDHVESLAAGAEPVCPRLAEFRFVKLRLTDASVVGIWKLSAIEFEGFVLGGRL